MLTVVSVRILRTNPRLKGKATAAGHRFLLLSLLLRQLFPTHDERRDPVSTCQQPVQTRRQFQVHPMTMFSLIPLPQSTMNSVIHNH
jgi:hypothetical protein